MACWIAEQPLLCLMRALGLVLLLHGPTSLCALIDVEVVTESFRGAHAPLHTSPRKAKTAQQESHFFFHGFGQRVLEALCSVAVAVYLAPPGTEIRSHIRVVRLPPRVFRGLCRLLFLIDLLASLLCFFHFGGFAVCGWRWCASWTLGISQLGSRESVLRQWWFQEASSAFNTSNDERGVFNMEKRPSSAGTERAPAATTPGVAAHG